jgi:hypothetical protein
MKISPFRKVYLYKVAVAIAQSLMETVLSPSRLFCVVSYSPSRLGPEEFEIVGDLVRQCLGELSQYVYIAVDMNKIEISQVQPPVVNRVMLPDPNTEE